MAYSCPMSAAPITQPTCVLTTAELQLAEIKAAHERQRALVAASLNYEQHRDVYPKREKAV